MRRLLLTLLVVAVLAAGLDIGARFLAGRGASEMLRRSAGLGPEPSVSFAGFPFLTQAVRGTYDEIRIDARDVPTDGAFTVDDVRATLVGARLPLSDLVDRSVSHVPVDRATVRAVVGFDTLDAAAAGRIGDDRLTVRFSPGSGSDRAAVRGRYRSSFGDLPIRGEVRLEVRGDTLRVEPVEETFTDVPRALRPRLAELLATSYPVGELPLDLRVDGVSVGADGIALTATGTDLVLR